MKTMLRNAARRWANRRLVSEADQLRHQLIRATAAAERHEQTAAGATKACNDAGHKLLQANAYNDELRAELKHKEDQIQRQANLFEQLRDQVDRVARERDAARERSVVLELAIVAMSGAADPVDAHQVQMARALKSNPLGGK